jgi:hypothetical protein
MVVNIYVENKRAADRSDTIYYDFNKNLTWSDFKGKPDNNHFGGAVTASGFAFDSQMDSDGKNIYLNVGVYTFFSKSDSWKKPGINSEYHLLHEQHHFDITRLSTERFVDELRKAHFTEDNYNQLLSSLFDKAYRENTSLQQQYDSETSHSLNTDKQKEWNNKIASAILQLRHSLESKS